MREDLGESATQNEVELRSRALFEQSEFARHLSEMRSLFTELAQNYPCYAWLVWSSKISVG